ncbi:MAG: acyl-CoA dehydrogenase, partial [Robiginitomaculum sp.]
MDFAYTDKTNDLRRRVTEFLETHILPRHAQFQKEVEAGTYPISFLADLKALAKSEGLWNLFLPHLRDGEPGTKLTNMEYAPLA